MIIKAESGINDSDTYSIQLKTNVSNVQTEDVKTIATGITFERKFPTSLLLYLYVLLFLCYVMKLFACKL